MTMQLKFNNQNTIQQSLIKRLIKILGVCLVFTILVFLLDKVNFPSPQKDIKEDITNEITQLK
ncbi:hypothetical protein OAS47_03030 [Pelagibacteraceae bacterium]|nr:hypothetical protein [Pelagibacteraceae bacterium]